MQQYNAAGVFDFVHAVILLGLRYRFSVTSWLRSPLHNVEVGGQPTSYHLVALAVDIILDKGEDVDAFKTEAARLGLSALDERDHIHLQPK